MMEIEKGENEKRENIFKFLHTDTECFQKLLNNFTFNKESL